MNKLRSIAASAGRSKTNTEESRVPNASRQLSDYENADGAAAHAHSHSHCRTHDHKGEPTITYVPACEWHAEAQPAKSALRSPKRRVGVSEAPRNSAANGLVERATERQKPHTDDDDDEQYEPFSPLAAKVGNRKDSVAKLLDKKGKGQHVTAFAEVKETNADDEQQHEPRGRAAAERSRSVGVLDKVGASSLRDQPQAQTLIRKLSLRPTAAELEDRNILHRDSEDVRIVDFQERRNVLFRKVRLHFASTFLSTLISF